MYQKAYFECFVSPEKANVLTQMVTNHPSINMYAINNDGQDLKVGAEEGGVTALTWGVFPNREILQPVSCSCFSFFSDRELKSSNYSCSFHNPRQYLTPIYSQFGPKKHFRCGLQCG